MAFNFTREEPVLNFRPRAHVRPAMREYVLWPAWAYRVVAPRVRDRRLNMFQRAVLGLCRAGVVRAEIIGQKLAIHQDLAAVILVELTKLGYVDGNGCPTEQGLSALAEDAVEAHDMVAGYVFQDPWNGELWPRFVERLDYCELEYEESGFPTLLLGSTGKPKRLGAFMIFPAGISSVSRPTPTSVVAAVSSHRKRIRYAENLVDWDEDLGEPGYAPSAVHINCVSFVEEEPEPVYLMTYLYLADGSEGIADWYACDPFGLGGSVRLRRCVEQIMQTMPPLYDVVNRLVGRGVHEGLEEQIRWVDQLKISAELEVERCLTVNARGHSAFDQIVNMEFAKQEVALLGEDCPGSKRHDALRSCSKALEALFGAIADRHPLEDVWKRVYVTRINQKKGSKYMVPQPDRKWLAEKYRSAAVSVGFEEPIPESLLNIKPGHIRSVAEFGDRWRLRPLVAACLLAAQLDVDHSLRKAARCEPGLLNDVENVAKQGGMAGHASDRAVALDDVERTVECTYTIISVLLGLQSVNTQSDVIENGRNHGEK
jgi:hypothetical protein